MRQTVNMRIRPGSLFPSIGIERASIAHETVASVVVIVMVCSVLKVDFAIHQNITNYTLEILSSFKTSIIHSMKLPNKHEYSVEKKQKGNEGPSRCKPKLPVKYASKGVPRKLFRRLCHKKSVLGIQNSISKIYHLKSIYIIIIREVKTI